MQKLLSGKVLIKLSNGVEKVIDIQTVIYDATGHPIIIQDRFGEAYNWINIISITDKGR